ncbi:PREDICTED: uncharacterized protein LOC104611969 [Nelumbo nucifera]|uniref:Uncharacterized protein LOC104611969 n=1 Tax=Nelumbo nucifera TaxID=4432 RepID=A0A1U8BCJ8_NELNU|nr:PREDICTED: uncharacterized protein LOC104611969 [Nelumbo nucifera]
MSSKQIPSDAPLTVRPYPKKEDENNMRIVTPVEIKIPNITYNPPSCDVTQDVPTVIFATIYTGNIYHEFNDIAIPLFLTCRHFQLRIRFIVTNFKARWVTKFNPLLLGLSSYPANNGKLLRESFNLRVKHESEIQELNMVIVSCRRMRMLVNEDDLVRVAKGLGYHVIRASPDQMANLRELPGVLNRCSVLVGARRVGLTNNVFLPEGVVVVQVVEWSLEWASEAYYGGVLVL